MCFVEFLYTSESVVVLQRQHVVSLTVRYVAATGWQGDRGSVCESTSVSPRLRLSNLLAERKAFKGWRQGLKSRRLPGSSPPKEAQRYLQEQQRWRRGHPVWATLLPTLWKEPSLRFRAIIWMAQLFQDMKSSARPWLPPKSFITLLSLM